MAMQFQSTHPRGVRLDDALALLAGNCGFNPRTRVGCDAIRTSSLSLIRLFQSTHPRGVRQKPPAPCGLCFQFQSTHPRGVRQ